MRLRTSVKEWLQFYRLLPWQQKVSNARLLLYALLGYAIAGQWHLPIIALNTLALLGLIMFQGALNDYWDFRLSNERNSLGALIQTGRLPASQAPAHIIAPLALSLPTILAARRLGCPWTVPVLLLVGVLLACAYSIPPLRLKTRRPFGILVAPLLTTLMFLEAHLSQAPLTAFGAQLLISLSLFQSYAEMLHVLRGSAIGEGTDKCSPRAAHRWARWSQLASAMCAAGFAIVRPIFLLNAGCSMMRWLTVRRIVPGDVVTARSRPFGSLLCLHEFVGCAIFGVWHAS